MSGPFYADDWLSIYEGDALATLRELPDAAVDTIVTSPPYYGLRDYGTDRWQGGDPDCAHDVGRGTNVPQTKNPGVAYPAGAGHRGGSGTCARCGATRTNQQLGLEPTPEEYVERLVDVFAEARRVLKPHGSLWLNLGDSYASAGGGRTYGSTDGVTGRADQPGAPRRPPAGIKPKDLIGIPWMVAFALRADGWYLRRDNIWDKPNGMPESVRDRTTTAHEYIFHLTRSPDYYYDAVAVREPFTSSPSDLRKMAQGKPRIGGKNVTSTDRRLAANSASHIGRTRGVGDAAAAAAVLAGEETEGGRNLRSVWRIATRPYPGAHYAVFPESIPDRCIRLTSSSRGVCPSCGAPWWRRAEVGDWAPGCGCGWGGRPDDLELLGSPERRNVHDDREYRLATGHRGLHRERPEGAGIWWVTRHQQRAMAAQMRGWTAAQRQAAIDEIGAYGDEPTETPDSTFAHYLRTDSAGARVAPRGLLERWQQRGWLTIPEPPDFSGALDPIPATVLDPFAGSGTVGKVANGLSRRAILIDLNGDYLRQQLNRNAQLPIGLEGVG